MLAPRLHSQGIAKLAHTRDGRSLFYQELVGPHPGASPTVVFENGLAATRSFWGLVQPEVARFAKAIVYDRSGLGRSEYHHIARPVAQMAGDLNDLLDQLGPGPFVLVAHSGGGPIVREATAAKPERIAGLVLVDVPDEGCLPLFDKTFVVFEKAAHFVSCLLARLRLLSFCYRQLIAPLPSDVRRDLVREGFTVTAMRTRGAELKGLRSALEQYRHQPPILPAIPIALISGVKPDFGMSKRLRNAATVAHQRRAQQLRNARQVLATQSGHCVLLTEPALIVGVIKQMIDQQACIA